MQRDPGTNTVEPLPAHPYRLDSGAWHSGIRLEGCLGWMVIIFSPFIGFAIHGKVSGEALAYAIFPLIIGLGMIVVSRIRVRKSRSLIPPEVLAQARHGKLFPAMAAPTVERSPLAFYIKSKERGKVELNAQGVLISPGASPQSSRKEDFSALYFATLKETAADFPVRWEEMQEWQVISRDEDQGRYVLLLHGGATIGMARSRDRSIEPRILDYVRSVGQCPVRLCDDAGK